MLDQEVVNAVNRKADSGELRLALTDLPANIADTLVLAALRRRKMASRWVDIETVTAALQKAGWPEDEIEFALYRETK